MCKLDEIFVYNFLKNIKLFSIFQDPYIMSGDRRTHLSTNKDRSYRVGDVILRCKIPFAYVVNQNVADTTCDECLKRTTDTNSSIKSLLRCSGKYILDVFPILSLITIWF